MKKLLVMLGAIVTGSCNPDREKEQSYMDITVIRDLTDPHELEPDPSPILGLYDLAENKSASVNFRYHEITDKMLVPVVSVQLPNARTTKRMNRKNEPLFREKDILNFYDTIRKTLDANNINSDSTFLSHSECFRTIAEELRLLAQSNSQKKIILIFSNLFENSDLSAYTETIKALHENSNAIQEKFEKRNLLPENLHGIDVFLLYKPKGRAEDRQYLEMVDVYSKMLQPRGAKVIVRANNNYEN